MNTEESRLYYECHITVQRPTDQQIDKLEELAKKNGWKVATFLMKKGVTKPPEGFISTRGKNLLETKKRVSQMLEDLEDNGLSPIRWKIEDTLFDSNHGDTREVLNVT